MSSKSFADQPNTPVHDSMHSFMGHPNGQFNGHIPEASQVRHFPSAVALPRASSTRTNRRDISLLKKARVQAMGVSRWTWSTEAQSSRATPATLGRAPSSRPALRTRTSPSLQRAMATSGCMAAAARCQA